MIAFDESLADCGQYFAISEWTVNGSCLCNGHATQCQPVAGESVSPNKVSYVMMTVWGIIIIFINMLFIDIENWNFILCRYTPAVFAFIEQKEITVKLAKQDIMQYHGHQTMIALVGHIVKCSIMFVY